MEDSDRADSLGQLSEKKTQKIKGHQDSSEALDQVGQGQAGQIYYQTHWPWYYHCQSHPGC